MAQLRTHMDRKCIRFPRLQSIAKPKKNIRSESAKLKGSVIVPERNFCKLICYWNFSIKWDFFCWDSIHWRSLVPSIKGQVKQFCAPADSPLHRRLDRNIIQYSMLSSLFSHSFHKNILWGIHLHTQLAKYKNAYFYVIKSTILFCRLAGAISISVEIRSIFLGETLWRNI